MSVPFEMIVESALWEPSAHWRGIVGRALDACAAVEGDRWRGREISVLLCDDAAIRDLNRQWLEIDKPTNVLSFPASGPAHSDAPLGDIALAFETIAREAHAEGKTIDDHVTHLVIHGTLHLIGYDHGTDAEADAMEARERTILATLGIADPYADAPSFEHAS